MNYTQDIANMGYNTAKGAVGFFGSLMKGD
jgi:hypothetical protein